MKLKHTTHYYFEILLTTAIFLLIIFLPSYVDDRLMNGTQSGKFFFFAYAISGILIIWSICLLFKNNGNLRISVIDILLFLFVAWISLNKYVLHDVHCFSLRYFELLGLLIFYLIIRAINSNRCIFLLLAICIGGTIQAIYGNLQLWGVYPSHHEIFNMTGSFFNPGPYAGYLCIILPIAVGLLWSLPYIEPRKSSKKTIKEYLQTTSFSYFKTIHFITCFVSIITIISILFVLPATRTRAAWLGAIAGTFYLVWYRFNLGSVMKQLNNHHHLNLFKHPNKRIFRNWILVILIIMIFTIGIFLMYHFKKGSADGRLLIWKVSTNIIKDFPFVGVGHNMLPAHYMKYQAAYFQDNPSSKFEMYAGDNQYAFNEFLNIWAENGLVGLILFILLLFSIFSQSNNFNKTNRFKAAVSIKHEILKPPDPQAAAIISSISINGACTLKYETIIRSSFMAILIFSCFGYPSEILPIKIISVTNLAMLFLLKFKEEKEQKEEINKTISTNIIFFNTEGSEDNAIKPRRSLFLTKIIQYFNFQSFSYFAKWYKISILITTLIVIIISIPKINNLKTAYILWEDAYEEYNFMLYKECLNVYKMAWMELKNNGEYLLCYGKALGQAGEFDKSVCVLERSTKYMNNSITYTAIGDGYQTQNKNKQAEESYLLAHWMIPSQFYPEYLLAKHFEKLGNKEKALKYAQIILNKPIKIPSLAIKGMKEEMKIIVKQ